MSAGSEAMTPAESNNVIEKITGKMRPRLKTPENEMTKRLLMIYTLNGKN